MRGKKYIMQCVTCSMLEYVASYVLYFINKKRPKHRRVWVWSMVSVLRVQEADDEMVANERTSASYLSSIVYVHLPVKK